VSPAPRRAPEAAPPPSTRLRRLAHQVERLATAGRFDPERTLIEKQAIAHALRCMARELEAR
jgi:hypothetical protein